MIRWGQPTVALRVLIETPGGHYSFPIHHAWPVTGRNERPDVHTRLAATIWLRNRAHA